jgi:uncharacterized protein (TIGR02996 family)
MPHEDAFLQAVIENPDDAAPRLVFADRLEEHGDPRAAALRAYPEIPRFLARLNTAPEAPFDQLERHAQAGEVELLRCLARTLEACRGLIRNPNVPGVVALTSERLERVLALTPGLSGVGTLLERLGARTPSPAQTRAFASMLAGGQPAGVLAALYERHGGRESLHELFACLAQEMVLRGAAVGDLPAVRRFTHRLQEGGRPLAHLPLSLTGVEGELGGYLHRYSPRGSSWTTPSGLTGEAPRPLPRGTGGRTADVIEATDEASAREIAAAVRDWQDGSNGVVEARVFRAARPLADGDLTVGFLQSLGLDSLPASEEGIAVERVSPGRAVRVLFCAASGGGAYTAGLMGAYGRLAAGLVGAAGGESIEGVAALAKRRRWLSFAAASGWFNDVAWDVGLAAVRPDGTSLAVLAATDTD